MSDRAAFTTAICAIAFLLTPLAIAYENEIRRLFSWRVWRDYERIR